METHNQVPTRYVIGLPGPGSGNLTFPHTIPSSDPHVLLKPVTVLQGYRMYQCYEPVYIHPSLPIPSYTNQQQQPLTQESGPLSSSYQQIIDDVVVVDLDVAFTTDDHGRDYRADRMKKEANLEACLDIKMHSSSTKQSSEASSDHDMCVVCHSEYEDNEKIGSIKNCGRQYHLDCIKKLLKRKNLCPICKGTAFAKGEMVIKPRERRSGDHTNWL